MVFLQGKPRRFKEYSPLRATHSSSVLQFCARRLKNKFPEKAEQFTIGDLLMLEPLDYEPQSQRKSKNLLRLIAALEFKQEQAI